MSIKQYDVPINTDKNYSDWKILQYVKPKSIILEFGPAFGRMTKYMKEALNCEVYIVEIDKEAYQKAIKYAKGGICGNILDYLWLKKFKGIKFDHIIFADVLEHLLEPSEALKKSVSLLKKDGSVLVSIPNMAHSSIIINLIKNKLEYRKSGLLDETHIKFFTYFSLIDMLENCSLIPIIEDGVIFIPENTEFKNSYKEITNNTEVIENREFANVYQFVFKCIKKDYYLKNKDANPIQKIYDDKTAPLSIIYIDNGSGFNTDEYMIVPLNKQGNKFKIDIKLKKDVKKIRFDPYEGYACIIGNLRIITNNDVIEYKYTNGISINNVIVFDTTDPQIIIDFNGKAVSKIKITGNIYRYDFDDIPLLSKCKWVFEQYIKVVSERDEVVSERDELINERNGLLNSRSWRITKPLRNFAAFIKRHRKLYFFIKGILSIKRHGLKNTFRRYILYIQESKDHYKVDKINYKSEYQENIDFSKYKPKAKAIAFYLPQFHAIPENDKWWGKGFTEWANTRKVEPRFKGHYQPREPHRDIGYYNLTNIETIKKQAKLAKQHGIYAFCFYLYWFSGKRLLEKPLDLFLEHPEIDINFCLCWANENWTRVWDGQDKEVLMKQNYSEDDPYKFIDDIKKYVIDKRYIRIDGEPIILVYNPSRIPNVKDVFNKWREHAINTGIGKIKIWICRTFGQTAKNLNIINNVDGEVDFPPNINLGLENKNTNLSDKTAYIFDYEELVTFYKQKIISAGISKIPVFHTCMLAWDNAARRASGWVTFTGFSLRVFFEWVSLLVEKALKNKERIFFINAWNEWAEGTYLEPEKKYGYANINTFSKAIYGFTINDNKIHSFNRKYSNINKRIIFVGHDAWKNGAQLLALNIIRQLKDIFNYEVFTILKSGGNLVDDFKAVSDDTIILDEVDKTDLKKWIKYTNASIAICNTVVTGDILHLLTKYRITCISLIHEMEGVIRQYSYEKNLKYITKDARKIIYPSEYVMKSNNNVITIPKEKIIIYPQGLYKINLNFINRETERSTIRKKYNIPQNSKIVLGVGYGYYRKGIDLFVQCMLKVCERNKDTYFIWVGDVENAMLSKVNELLKNTDQKNRFIITGWEENIIPYYSAAEIYLLTSREDPFPSVVLEAMNAYLPVIAFENGGGYVEIVNNNTGRLVPMENVESLSESTINLLNDYDLRMKMGKYAHNLVAEKFNFVAYIYFLLEMLGKNYKKISVIIPNYNYAKYLRERIESILSQTYPVFEIIILDDHSTDNSLEIINEYKNKFPLRVKSIVNEKNSGNVFEQWAKGIEIAKGDYVWIAEADDLSEPIFLEAIMKKMTLDEDIVMGYTQSKIMDEQGNITGDNYLFYTDKVDTIWKADYTSAGKDEIEKRLSVMNTILNVSAVVFKNINLSDKLKHAKEYSVAGDWRFYIDLLKDDGKLLFIADSLNIHRRHTNSVTKALNAQKHFDEICNMQDYIFSLTKNSRYFDKAKIYRNEVKEYLKNGI